MDFKSFLDVLWRRRWILFFVLVCTAGTAIVGSILLPSFYEAQARFVVSAASGETSVLASLGLRDDGQRMVPVETDLPNRLALATVKPLLMDVIAKLQLRDGDGDLYKPERLMQFARLSGRPSVKLEQLTNTQLIRIRARSRDREQAAMIANTLAEFYMERNRIERREEYSRAREFVQQQIVQVKADYLQALAEIRDFRITHESADLALETQAGVARLAELLKEQEAAVVALAEARARKAMFDSQLQIGEVSSVTGAALSENRHLEDQASILADLESQRAAMLVEKKPDHPDVLILDRKIANIRERLMADVAARRGSDPGVLEVGREIAALEARCTNVTRQIGVQLARVNQLPAKSFLNEQLDLRHSVSRNLYDSLLQYLHQIGIAEAMTLSGIKLVEPASTPDSNNPAGPNRMAICILGLFFGMVTGVGLAFVVERLDDAIRTPEEAKDSSNLPILATIPRFGQKKDRSIAGLAPADPVCESYRLLKNNLLFVCPDRVIRSIVVTSALASEGKTTTVSNLGITLARDGKKVLLVDTDLRKPRLHSLWGLSNARGVMTVIGGDMAIGSAIQETKIPGLHVLTSGPIPPDPGRVVESLKMKKLVTELANAYDLVIFDSPPVLAVHDAIVLAGMLDGSLSVLECGRETRTALKYEKVLMEQAGLQPLGIVVNKFKPSGLGYSGYGHYYSTAYRDNSKHG